MPTIRELFGSMVGMRRREEDDIPRRGRATNFYIQAEAAETEAANTVTLTTTDNTTGDIFWIGDGTYLGDQPYTVRLPDPMRQRPDYFDPLDITRAWQEALRQAPKGKPIAVEGLELEVVTEIRLLPPDQSSTSGTPVLMVTCNIEGVPDNTELAPELLRSLDAGLSKVLRTVFKSEGKPVKTKRRFLILDAEQPAPEAE